MAPNRDPFDVLTELWEPRIRDAFLEAIRSIGNKVSLQALIERLELRDIDGALRIVGLDPNDFVELTNRIAETYGQGGKSFIGQIPAARALDGAVIKVLFDIRNPSAERWIVERSSMLVTEIVGDQQASIRAHLIAGLSAGQNPRSTALDLVGRISRATGTREGGVIGLTSTQAAWGRSYAAELASGDPAQLRKALERGLRDKRFDRTVAKAIRDGEPIPADMRAKMVSAYRNKSLRYRAETIARNETIRALGAAQVEAYEQAITRRQITVEQITKFWRTMDDTRVRPTHRMIPGLNKEGRGWREPFQTPSGPSMHAPHDHDVLCRCREVVRLNYFKGLR
ncbi:phage minor head protein [Ancylobacter sp. VNQ12]|uniref:phage minor head protein n=1 Tax=Ancylobacter sp. VNQ12 TaxID=3400920 RepID=UPI003C095168